MLRQGKSCNAPQTVFQFAWCLRKTFILTHKFGIAWATEITADREEWPELPIGATTTHNRSGTSVIRRARCSTARMGRADNLITTRHSCEVKGCSTWRFVVVEPNYSWWWPFKSPTNRNEARTSSACKAATDVGKQSKIQSSRSRLFKVIWTHKSSVSKHKH